ncbi:MAG: N-6 DNA methylase, partial [Pseudonocardiaceae bacterium]
QPPTGNDHWRAVCAERRPYRSGRGRRKRTRTTGTSPAAYFTRRGATRKRTQPGHLAAWPTRHRRQWERLSNLPNLIYTDGTCWARYETGVRKGEIIKLNGTLTEGPGDLRVAGPDFEQMLVTFLGWAPSPIRNVDALVRAVAPACRLLRDEVADQLAREKAGSGRTKQLFSGLAADWRRLLFPTADDGEFADGYAQTVTFGLLYARSRGIAFEDRGYHEIGDLIAAGNTLMGRALQVLTDQFGGSSEQVGPFKVTLDTLLRVIGAVDWERVRSGRRDTYLYLYEHFLAEYDPVLRQESGVYYTPVELVEPMVRLTDDALRTRLGLSRGLGTDRVRVVDPAAGTGTFLLRILDTVFDRVELADGTGGPVRCSVPWPAGWSGSSCRWGRTR